MSASGPQTRPLLQENACSLLSSGTDFVSHKKICLSVLGHCYIISGLPVIIHRGNSITLYACRRVLSKAEDKGRCHGSVLCITPKLEFLQECGCSNRTILNAAGYLPPCHFKECVRAGVNAGGTLTGS